MRAIGLSGCRCQGDRCRCLPADLSPDKQVRHHNNYIQLPPSPEPHPPVQSPPLQIASMNKDVLLFFLVLAVCRVIGEFVGAEWSDYDKNFSPTGALVAAIGTAVVLLGLGAFFDRRDRQKRQNVLPDDIRGVQDRMTGRAASPAAPVARPRPRVRDAVDASIQRKRAAVDPERIKTFVQVVLKFRSLTDPIKTAELAITKLFMQNDSVIAAIKSQKEFLDVLLDSSQADPSLMGIHIANSCSGLCELVVEGKVNQSIGREYFDIYKKVFERVDGIRMPFEGGPFAFDTSLELARDALNRKGSHGGSGGA